MREIVNFKDVKAGGSFQSLPSGGYICRIKDVSDNPDKEYLKISYDIDEGEFQGFFTDIFKKHGFWGGVFLRSYKGKAVGVFKRFIECLYESNDAFSWDWKEESLKDLTIGLIIVSERYQKKNGQMGDRAVVRDFCTVSDIESGNFTVPAASAKQNYSQGASMYSSFGFHAIPDDDDVEFPF